MLKFCMEVLDYQNVMQMEFFYYFLLISVGTNV